MDKWIIQVIVGYVIFVSFIFIVTANLNFDANAFDLTPDQIEILSSTSTDAISMITRYVLISSLSSEYAFINFILFIFTIVLILALAKALKEVIPALPS